MRQIARTTDHVTLAVPVRTAGGRRMITASGRSAFEANQYLTRLVAGGLAKSADWAARFTVAR